MTEVPSIKGFVVAGHAEVLMKYLASNPVDSDVLDRRFPSGELEILSGPIHTGSWYDIKLYRRLMEFLRDYEGDGDNEYLVAAGKRSADKLIQAGFYQQMEYLKRTQLSSAGGARERYLAFGRDLRLIASLNRSILNFVHVEVREDPKYPDRWMSAYLDAAPFPEVLCWTTQGFSNRMAEEHDTPDLWYWERPRPDVVLMRMTRSL